MKDKAKYIQQLAGQGFFEAMGDGISIQDTDFKVLYQNNIHKNLIGDHIGEYCYKGYENRDSICKGCPVVLSFKDGQAHTTERTGTTDNGRLYVEITASPLKDSSGQVIAGIEIVRDITARRVAEKKLAEYNQFLEESVKERTKELEEQKVNLEQKNIALREIIGQIEFEKNKIKGNVLTNIDELIIPILKEFNGNSSSNGKYIDLLMQNLEKIASSFGNTITNKNLKLTPREIEICNMVEKGFTNKEIANFLKISVRSIEDYRKNIRKKLGLTNKKVNLTAYLRDLV